MKRQLKMYGRVVSTLVAISMAGLLVLTGCSSTGNSGGDDKKDPVVGSVTIVVDITAAVEADDPTAVALSAKYNGSVYEFNVDIKENATVLSATEATQMIIVMKGDFADSIDGLAAGAVAQYSGWTFTVNDDWALEGPGHVSVKDGDEIAWTYVTSWD
jgi:hypothetical protein